MPSHDSEKAFRVYKSPESLPPLVVILGPTAVGKTEIAIQLAERLDGEIVSADSRLFYRDMDIGTAKPTPADRARVPHHLIDITDPDEVWNLALFQRAAYHAVEDIYSRGRLPFLVGGTGQYIYAVIEGWVVPESRPDPQLRAALRNWADEIGPEGLHARLFALDPEAAGKMDPRNLRRSVRALEVILSSGRRFSAQARRSPPPYRTIIHGFNRPRPELYARIDARIQAMLENGFVEEVQYLLHKGYDPGLPTLSAIGYREIIAHIKGEITLDEAVRRMKRLTRQFVRHQANWFKDDDPDIHWFRVGPQTVNEVEEEIRSWVATIH